MLSAFQVLWGKPTKLKSLLKGYVVAIKSLRLQQRLKKITTKLHLLSNPVRTTGNICMKL